MTITLGRESAAVKGRRYLTEGRDSGEVYKLGYGPQAWHCNCPALRRCSHLVALQLVTVLEPRESAA